jgi:magnesium chelatase family protein
MRGVLRMPYRRPLMDRIDIRVDVQRVPYQELTAMDGGENSASIRTRIEAARERQQARFAKLDKPDLLANGDMGHAEVQTCYNIDDAGSNLMRAAVKQMDLSARAYHRVPLALHSHHTFFSTLGS